MGATFPILVNDDARRLDCSYDSGRFSMTMFNAEGEAEFSKVLEVE